MRLVLSVALLLGMQSFSAWSQSASEEDGLVEDTSPLPDDIKIMEAMVVTGAQPGPGMWKVSKGDNVLWIMGTQSPLPKKMEWASRDVEKTIARADEILFLSDGRLVERAEVNAFFKQPLSPEAIEYLRGELP